MAQSPIRIWKKTPNGQDAVYWDGLRRDPDLWFEDADCLVYFHQEGQSRRGPSIQIPFKAVLSTHCTPIIYSRDMKKVSTKRAGRHSLGTPHKVNLYLAPPSNFSLAEAQRWNITTRNFFAWMMGKPLVGDHLGPALEDLLDRMKVFRSRDTDSLQDLLTFSERLGYLDFAGQPENALAMLYFAESQQLGTLWIDAFAHCMGMDPHLAYCTELKPISQRTKTSLTRAYLAVQLKIEQGLVSLGNLLEKEISAGLDLDIASALHMNEFRLFLHSYFAAHYGNWPPPLIEDSYPKKLFEAMRADLDALYSYLADHGDVTGAWASSLHTDGVCLRQSIESLNKSQNWDPLPYSCSLLPQTPANEPEASSLKFFKTSRSNKREKRTLSCVRARLALQHASNRSDDYILASPLVQAFDSFECEEFIASEDFISLAEGRKVRWLLVYGLLQKLISLTAAPAEVTDPVSALYPLCCGKDIAPPWEERSAPPTPSALTDDTASKELQLEPVSPKQQSGPSSRRSSIQPDYETMSNDDLAPVRMTQSNSAVSSQHEDSERPSRPKRRSTIGILPKASWLNRLASVSIRHGTSLNLSSRKGLASTKSTTDLPGGDVLTHSTGTLLEGDEQEDEAPLDKGTPSSGSSLEVALPPQPDLRKKTISRQAFDASRRYSSEDLSESPSMILREINESVAPLNAQSSSPPSLSSSTSSLSNKSPVTEQSSEEVPIIIDIDRLSSDELNSLQKSSAIDQHHLLKRIAPSLSSKDDSEISERDVPVGVSSLQTACMLSIPHCQCTAASA